MSDVVTRPLLLYDVAQRVLFGFVVVQPVLPVVAVQSLPDVAAQSLLDVVAW